MRDEEEVALAWDHVAESQKWGTIDNTKVVLSIKRPERNGKQCELLPMWPRLLDSEACARCNKIAAIP